MNVPGIDPVTVGSVIVSALSPKFFVELVKELSTGVALAIAKDFATCVAAE